MSLKTKYIKSCVAFLLMLILFTQTFLLVTMADNKGKNTTQTAVVNTDNTKLYKKQNTDSKVMCVLYKNMSFVLIKQNKKFSQILVPKVGKYWVKSNSIKIKNTKLQLSSKAKKKQAKLIQKGKIVAKQIEKEKKKNKLRIAICKEAKKYVGVLPYVYGGSDLRYGVDCSGFTSAIYRKFNINIPRASDAQTWGGKTVSIKNIKVGDIVCYQHHVAIYIGHNQIVHATVPGQYITISHINVISPIVRIVRYI